MRQRVSMCSDNARRKTRPEDDLAKGFNGKKILVAEDDELVALMLSDQLAEMGFGEIEITSSVAAALQKLGAFRPDVALLDVQLADGSTSALARVLNMRSIPFAVMSGDPAKARRLSPPKVPPLAKPFSPATLREAIQAALDN